jgi:serine/threonine protein kinase
VRHDGIAKILDFGVARLASSSMTAAGFIVGTPDYMSPEQARGENIDGRSDVFSLGGVFYFMLTGRKPFPATELPSLFNQIQNSDPAPLLDTDAPPELAAVIVKALSKKVDDRYQSCQELLDDIEDVKRRYPLASHRTTAAAASTTAAAEVPHPTSNAVVAAAPTGAGDEALDPTDDTVDSVPVGVFSTDDTVAMKAPTWVQRVTGRLDSAMSGAFARVRRQPAQNPPGSTGIRKR